ncbi:MAG: beta strand repeat-containing protein, partial [Roseimicrobium sp.]
MKDSTNPRLAPTLSCFGTLCLAVRRVLAAVALLVVLPALHAQQSITTSPFTQSFDGMGNLAASPWPSGFKHGTDWSSGLTAGTQAGGTATGTSVLTSTSSGAAYNFANGVNATSTDRAIGFLTSGGFTSPRSLIFAFTNNTGSTVTGMTVNWDYEKYRSGSRAIAWTFFHGSTSTADTAATGGNQSYSADADNTVVSNPPASTSKSVTLTGLSIANGSTYYLRWTYTGSGGSSNAQALAIDNVSVAFAQSTPTLASTKATLSAFSTTYGTASAADSFSVSGSLLTANVTVTAPTGLEVSQTSATTGFADSLTLVPTSGTLAATTVYARLKAGATVGANYNAQAIALASTGATTVNVKTAASGNTVSAKPLTIAGLTGGTKVYDGTLAATLVGTATLTGVVAGDESNVTLSGTPTATFGTNAVGTTKAITVTGYTLAGTASGNYTVSQPTGLTGEVQPKTLVITANALTKPYGQSISGGAGSTAFTSTGLVGTETIGSVTILYTSGAGANDAAGDYAGAVVPSDATGGTFAASNYTITYNAATLTVSANPILNVGGVLTSMSSTYGSPSAPSSFTVSGSNLTGNVTVTAPAGFEVSTTVDSGYATSFALVPTAGVLAETSVFTRLKAANSPASYLGSVTVTGGGASSASLMVPLSTVSPKVLTIAGVTVNSRAYNGDTDATFGSTGAYEGLVNGETFAIAGTPVAAFATKSVGTAKAVNISGYDAPAPQYTVTQPTGVTADITAKGLTLADAAVTTKAYDGTTVATITGTLQGAVVGDVVG